jgi:predicted transcriptional regulator
MGWDQLARWHADGAALLPSHSDANAGSVPSRPAPEARSRAEERKRRGSLPFQQTVARLSGAPPADSRRALGYGGHDGLVMGVGDRGALQEDLFGRDGWGTGAEPVLMALQPEYYELIWRGLKTHEFRRRFLEGRAVRWFVYLNAPVSRLAAVIELGPAVADTPDRIAALADRVRAGNGASVLDYLRDLDRAYAIPILRATEYAGLSADELHEELGRFHPPQGYVRLNQHPELLRVCEKVAAEVPVRQIAVHHR